MENQIIGQHNKIGGITFVAVVPSSLLDVCAQRVRGFLPLIALTWEETSASSSVSKICSESHGKKMSCRLVESISKYPLNATNTDL